MSELSRVGGWCRLVGEGQLDNTFSMYIQTLLCIPSQLINQHMNVTISYSELLDK